MSKAIVVNFTFPPFPGIGGRRWAKFAKYLHKNGHDIQIIAANKNHQKNSNWKRDIENYFSRITYLPTGYPRILTEIPNTFLQRWEYRFWLLYVKVFNPKGNYFDHSLHFAKYAGKEIEKWIHEGYNNVIISCGPFKMAADLLKLKSKYPQVKFILDFRDPWANNKTSFGFQTISEQRRNHEFELEKKAIDSADVVLSVSEEMNAYFAKLNPNSTTKFVCLANGYDTEDFDNAKNHVSAEKNHLQLVFAGTLYEKSQHVFQSFCNALKQLQKSEPELIGGISFSFFGSVPSWFHQHTSGLENTVKYGGNLNLQDVYAELGKSTACMLFLTDDLTYSRSTKFYEYLAMKKPIAVFSAGGATAAFVKKESLGFECNMNNMESDLRHMIQDLKNNTFAFNTAYNSNAHDVKELVKTIEQELI